MERMVVVEGDDDLAACITRYFGDRFDVSRAATLEKAAGAVRTRSAGILLADIDPRSPHEASIVERIHRDRPRMKLILTYLTPPTSEMWEKKIRESVDVIFRKPYRLLDVDKVIQAWNKKSHDQP